MSCVIMIHGSRGVAHQTWHTASAQFYPTNTQVYEGMKQEDALDQLEGYLRAQVPTHLLSLMQLYCISVLYHTVYNKRCST